MCHLNSLQNNRELEGSSQDGIREKENTMEDCYWQNKYISTLSISVTGINEILDRVFSFSHQVLSVSPFLVGLQVDRENLDRHSSAAEARRVLGPYSAREYNPDSYSILNENKVFQC